MSIEASIIHGVPMFSSLDDKEVQRLSEIIRVRGCIAGVPLFEAGEPSDAFYIISSGKIRIRLPQCPDKKIILERGAFFGEMGVVRGTRRSADALVEVDSILLEINKEDFDNLMAIDGAIAEKIVSAFIDRCNEMTKPEVHSSTLDPTAYVPSENSCRVVSVFSPSGGGGSTTIAANMALKAKEYTGKRVMLVDGDLQLGAVHLALGSNNGLATSGIFSESEISGATIEKYRRQLHYGIDIIVAPGTGKEIPMSADSQWRALVNNASSMYDYLFIDTCSELSELNLKLFELSDDVLFLISPEVVSVSRFVAAWNFLVKRNFPVERIKLVVNKHRKESIVEPEKLEEQFGKRIFGKICFDPTTCIDALNEGVPVVKRTPKEKVAIDMSRAIRQLLCLPASENESVCSEKSRFSLWNLFS
jgi:MinD-like ATPase involved in chromosome partitioning or flagellar assembly